MNRYPINYSLPEEDYIKDVLVIISLLANKRYKRLPNVMLGKWPQCTFDRLGRYTIYMPFKKKGRSFYDKLKMFAAHEMGHVLFTWDNAHVNKILNLSKFESTIHNFIEDIRIEHCIESLLKGPLSNILPFSFKDFRYLLHYQLGQASDDPIQLLLYKIQWYLLDENFDAGEENNIIFEERITNVLQPLIKIFKHQTPMEEHAVHVVLDITKYLAELFRELFSNKEEQPEKNKDEQLEDSAQETSEDSSQETSDDNESVSSSTKEQTKERASEENNSDTNSTNEESAEDSSEGESTLVQLMNEENNTNKENTIDKSNALVETIPLSKEVEDIEEATESNYIDENKLAQLIYTYITNQTAPVVYAKVEEELIGIQQEKFKHVNKIYYTSIDLFKKLFTGGWRAPKKVYKTEREYGELDCNLLYKAKFRGKERTLYQERTLTPLPGVNVLCLLDISGSMCSYIDTIIDTSIVLTQSASKDIKMRIVLFTDILVQIKDYDSKFILPKKKFIQENMSGTPTGEALEKEFKNFIYRSGDKFLVLVSDGEPNNPNYAANQLQQYADAGISILYIQFGDYKHPFNNIVTYSIYSKNVSSLPEILAQELHKVLNSYAMHKLKGAR